MDVYLKVLGGAKTGGTIAIKKDQFLIGRSRKCNLCAGSNAISRQHCLIVRGETAVTVEDLGSRNGTLVNDQPIDRKIEIHSGDELSIGPLRFMLTISHGIKNHKRPKAKSVAEVADRTAHSNREPLQEEDISSWLLGPEPMQSTIETQTIRLDDTNAAEMQQAMERVAGQTAGMDSADVESATQEAEKIGAEKIEKKQHGETSGADASGTVAQMPVAQTPEGNPPKKQKGPGKLPPLPPKSATKDSREAAAAALRSWGRRH